MKRTVIVALGLGLLVLVANDLTEMRPGKWYWVRATETTALIVNH